MYIHGLKKFLIFPFFISLPLYAMKKPTGWLTSARNMQIFQGSKFNSTAFSSTIRDQNKLSKKHMHFATSIMTQKKRKRLFNQEGLLGLFVTGISLGTLGGLLHNNYIYADEVDTTQQTIQKEFIDATDYKESLDFLKNKINKHPELVRKYQKAAIKQLSTISLNQLFNTNSNPYFIDALKILFKDSDLANRLCNKLAKHRLFSDITLLIKKNYSVEFTNIVINYIAQNLEKINSLHSLLSFNAFLSFLNFEDRTKIYNALYSKYNTLTKAFNCQVLSFLLAATRDTDLITHYAVMIYEQSQYLHDQQTEDFYFNLEQFVFSQKPFTSKDSVQLALQNLPLACNIPTFSELLYGVIVHELEQETTDSSKILKHTRVSELLVDQSSTIEHSKYGPFLLNSILEKNEILRKRWKNEIKLRLNTASSSAITLFSHYNNCDQELKKSLKQAIPSLLKKKIEHIIKSHAYNATCSQDCIASQAKNNNPTLIHASQIAKNFVQHYRTSLNGSFPDNIPYDQQSFFEFCAPPQLESMIKALLVKEQELNENGYYTFVHGQKKEYLFYTQLHTFLQQLKNNERCSNDYLDLHVKSKVDHPAFQRQQKRLRNHLLSNGIYSTHHEQKLLFVNWAYFSNITRTGASSAYYIKQNSNVRSVTLTVQEIFILHNIEHLYAKYKDKLNELQKEYDSLTNFGTCILVAIPRKAVNKHVYSSAGFGVKTPVAIDGIGKTDDISIIMETLLNSPEKINNVDQMEFCIPMTYDKKGILNPKSGIKIFAFIPTKQEKLDAYNAKKIALFEEIKNDIKKKSFDFELFTAS